MLKLFKNHLTIINETRPALAGKVYQLATKQFCSDRNCCGMFFRVWSEHQMLKILIANTGMANTYITMNKIFDRLYCIKLAEKNGKNWSSNCIFQRSLVLDFLWNLIIAIIFWSYPCNALTCNIAQSRSISYLRQPPLKSCTRNRM